MTAVTPRALGAREWVASPTFGERMLLHGAALLEAWAHARVARRQVVAERMAAGGREPLERRRAHVVGAYLRSRLP